MYDLIVIGDDLSSHIAAAAAANYGLNTALVAEHGTGGICLMGDFAFNIDPMPLSGFGANQIGLSLLAELDVPPIERESQLLNPAYQIILPEHRIDFYHDEDALFNELAREFPELSKEITAFYKSAIKNSSIFKNWLYDHPYIQPQNMKDRFRFLKMFPHLMKHKIERIKFKKLMQRNSSLKKVFEAQEALLSFNSNPKKNIFSTSFHYCAPLRGIYHFHQGKQIIFNSLIKKIEAKDGLYFSNCEILEIKKDRLIQVEVADKDGNTTKITSKNLIVSTKWDGMHLLLDGKKRINFSDWLRPAKVSHKPFTIHLGCAQKCIPEKIARHLAVVCDIDKDIYDNNLIILESSLPEDETLNSVAKISLTATVFLPNDNDIWARENLASTASHIIDRLEFFLPFLKDNIKFYDLEKSIDISKIQSAVVNTKYLIKNSFFTGFAAKPNKTRFKNIYLTGASLLADAGFEGEIISGINAASRVIGKEV